MYHKNCGTKKDGQKSKNGLKMNLKWMCCLLPILLPYHSTFPLLTTLPSPSLPIPYSNPTLHVLPPLPSPLPSPTPLPPPPLSPLPLLSHLPYTLPTTFSSPSPSLPLPTTSLPPLHPKSVCAKLTPPVILIFSKFIGY